MSSREVRLVRRPLGEPVLEDFEIGAAEAPVPGPGEVRVRNTWMSVDPYMRGRMSDRPSYVPPFQLGEAMQGGAIGEVVDSNDPSLSPGDLVLSMAGWREAFTAPASTVRKVDPHGLPPQVFLGAAGLTGFTAWLGLFEIGALKEGETVFVSAAAGAVGEAACQMAKLKGCTVIGSAGGPDKIAHLRSIGVDHAIDYKAERSLAAALRTAAPEGIDLYFDNVGADHLEAALHVLKPFGRAALCGMIAVYNAERPTPGPSNLALCIGKRLRLQGFIASDHMARMGAFLGEVVPWIAQGRLKTQETVVEGIDRAPEAFLRLFSGDKLGKMLVRL